MAPRGDGTKALQLAAWSSSLHRELLASITEAQCCSLERQPAVGSLTCHVSHRPVWGCWETQRHPLKLMRRQHSAFTSTSGSLCAANVKAAQSNFKRIWTQRSIRPQVYLVRVCRNRFKYTLKEMSSKYIIFLSNIFSVGDNVLCRCWGLHQRDRR